VVAVMGDVLILVCNFHVPLGSQCWLSVQLCLFVMVSIFLCVGLMAIFCGVAFFPVFFSIGLSFVVPHSWCGVSRLLISHTQQDANTQD
jgi:hypothetical protein